MSITINQYLPLRNLVVKKLVNNIYHDRYECKTGEFLRHKTKKVATVILSNIGKMLKEQMCTL